MILNLLSANEFSKMKLPMLDVRTYLFLTMIIYCYVLGCHTQLLLAKLNKQLDYV